MIYVDSHEPEKFIKKMKESFEGVVVETLPIGDIIDDELGLIVERKTITDLKQSFFTKHIHKQWIQMSDYQHAYVCIVGSMRDLHFNSAGKGWTVTHHLGAKTSILTRSNVKIIEVDNDTQLITVFKMLQKKITDGVPYSIEDTELLRSKLTKEHLKLKLLCSFHGVGIAKAKKFLEHDAVDNAIDKLILTMMDQGVKV